MDSEVIKPEDPLPEPTDIPSRDVASLIATVNHIDLQNIYSQQVKEVRKLNADGNDHVKERVKFN